MKRAHVIAASFTIGLQDEKESDNGIVLISVLRDQDPPQLAVTVLTGRPAPNEIQALARIVMASMSSLEATNIEPSLVLVPGRT